MNGNFRILMENIKDLSKRIYKWFKSPVFRVHILKIVAVGLTFTLLASVYMVHVIYAGEFVAFQEIATTANLSSEVARGVIFDRNMVPLVTNDSVNVITYRHIPNTYVEEMRRIAAALGEFIELSEEEVADTLTVRDKKDLFIMRHEEEARNLVPERQSLTNEEFYLTMLERIGDEHLAMLTHEELRNHTIFIRMNQGAGMTTNIIKENPSEAEIARVTENLINLPGIDIGVDWQRVYPSELHRSFFGHVSTRQQGIPREREAYFLSQGYFANARVGTSGLERSLQTYLSGFQSRYFIDEGRESQQLSQGLPGFDVTLNLDTELQLRLEEIVAEHLLNARRTQQTSQFTRSAYVVISNPNTGAVYAMVGIQLEADDNGVLQAVMNPLGTIQNAYLMGSSVKGASLMAGYHYGYTHLWHTRFDAPIHIHGSSPFVSFDNLGNVNDITAISRSSNVFFYRQTMEMTGNRHHQQGARIYSWDTGVWEMYLDYFASLGLGSRTGIELPESTGFSVPLANQGFPELLNFSIGQTNSYTTMQLAQFGGVLATNGDRMQMQLVQNIYMPGSDLENQQLVRGFQPNLLNRIELSNEQWHHINEGHRLVIEAREGTGHRTLGEIGRMFGLSGKTGTAEMFMTEIYLNENGEYMQRPMRDSMGQPREGNNRTFVGFAPRNNPEIVIAAVVPQSEAHDTPLRIRGSQLVNEIVRDAVQEYFSLQAERASQR